MPWIGYFHKIASVDAFVMLDNVQYKKNEFQNRNKIKTSSGIQWLTVPVKYKFPQKISEVLINNNFRWQHKQIQALRTNYSKAPYFKEYFPFFTEIIEQPWEKLASLNCFLVEKLCQLLGLQAKLYIASVLGCFEEEPNLRLIQICQHLKADSYLSGIGGRNYLKLNLFKEANIIVNFQHFKHPVYNQLYGDFVPNLSIIDLIFNCGKSSSDLIISNGGDEI